MCCSISWVPRAKHLVAPGLAVEVREDGDGLLQRLQALPRLRERLLVVGLVRVTVRRGLGRRAAESGVLDNCRN